MNWWKRGINWRVTLLRQHQGNTEEEWRNRHKEVRWDAWNYCQIRIICSLLTCQPHLFTSDKLSSNLVCSFELVTLLRPSVKLSTACSTLLQEPVEEKQQQKQCLDATLGTKTHIQDLAKNDSFSLSEIFDSLWLTANNFANCKIPHICRCLP